MSIKKVDKSVLMALLVMIFALVACDKNEDPTNTTPANGTTGTVTDYDGNTYKTVTIGKQTWMAENLKVIHYNDGTAIPNVTDNTAWINLSTPAYCWYNNDKAPYFSNNYGALYNWYAVNTGKLAPKGWHVPTDAEWTALTDYLASDGHSGTEGTDLKAKNGWNSNGSGTNDYGFTALPGGYRGDLYGTFGSAGGGGWWWSSTQYNSSSAYTRYLLYSFAFVDRTYYVKSDGFSVRCVRD